MDTDPVAKDRVTQMLRKHLELAQEQLDMAERGVLLSIDGAPEGVNLTRKPWRSASSSCRARWIGMRTRLKSSAAARKSYLPGLRFALRSSERPISAAMVL